LEFLYLFLVLLSVNGLFNIYDGRTCRKAADQGDAEAQMKLSKMYYMGWNGVFKNINESLKWIRKAADQGDSCAQYNLCWSYVNGKGVLKDGKEAVKWCLKAADQGRLDAKDLLASIYNFGLAGVYKNDK